MSVALPVRRLACLALAASTWAIVPGAFELRAALALLVLTGSLWLTQALPLAVTALLVPVLAVAGGLMEPRAALAPFAHPTIFLFLGGFALAAALRQQGLDRALAQAVLRAAGGRQGRAAVLLAGTTALLSMWMSNSPLAAMMLPLALGLLDKCTGEGAGEEAGEAPARSDAQQRTDAFVLLAMAYSTSIGGLGTIVGSPPNAIAAAQGGIGFAQWMAWGVPLVLVWWLLMMGVLWAVLRPCFGDAVIAVAAPPLVWTRPRVLTLAVFVLTVLAWVAGRPLAQALGIAADTDSWVALVAMVALVIGGALTWPQLEANTQWDVLVLFGGGLALSEVMHATGASRFVAQQALGALAGAPLIVVLAGVVVFVVALSELLSNTASAALVLPIFLPAVSLMGMPEPLAAFVVAAAASCGFMLPVATPPNAMVFATGRVPQAWMMRCGLWLNVVCAAVIVAMAWVLMQGT